MQDLATHSVDDVVLLGQVLRNQGDIDNVVQEYWRHATFLEYFIIPLRLHELA